jgi:hypothetical protein
MLVREMLRTLKLLEGAVGAEVAVEVGVGAVAD